MSHAHATISWPGVDVSDSWSFPFTPGIRPSTCTITVPADIVEPEARGTLKIRWTDPEGADQELEFPDCVLEQPPIAASATGTIARLPIKDRRHWWQYGAVSGSYNVKRPDGSFLREKTPRELAKLLLEAMGEQGFRVDALPETPRPTVNWDYANPAAELDRLCQSYGCIIVLNPVSNKVELWPEGIGPEPPDEPTLGRSNGFSLIAAPEYLTILGKLTIFDSLFYCEPVGEDIDGKLKKLDDLSYRPPGFLGWASADLTFYDLEGTYIRDGERRKIAELARSCVFKMFRIVGIVGGGWSPRLLRGTDLEPRSFDDIRLLQNRGTSATDSLGTPRTEPARAFVKSWEGGHEPDANTSPKVATSGFSIDAERGLVIFSEPQVNIVNEENLPATVWLRTGFHAGRDGALHHYTRRRKAPGGKADSGERIERRDITRRVVDQWIINMNNPADGQARATVDNNDSLHKDADAQIDALLKAYELQTSPTLTYSGLKVVSPTGRVQQITWQSGVNGITTTVSAGSRHNPYIPTLEDQRRERDARELAALLRAGEIRQGDAAQ